MDPITIVAIAAALGVVGIAGGAIYVEYKAGQTVGDVMDKLGQAAGFAVIIGSAGVIYYLAKKK